ncbi:MAG: hypothetical protein KGK07_17150, partial [Chloroflexota bacterium]|nr:hypothetical protein [Chloroflexota bacterium]
FAYHWTNGACPGTTTAAWDGVRTALPAPVAAGGSVSGLTVSIVVPPTAGTYCLVYDLVREGITWFSWQAGATQSGTVTVVPVYAVTWGANKFPTTAAPGATLTASVSLTDSGSLAWTNSGANPVNFAYHWTNGACPGTTTAVWDGDRTALPSAVAPGGSVSGLTVSIVAPPAAGTYCLVYDLVREGVTWFSSQGAATQSATVTVATPVYGVTWGANTLPSATAAGATVTATVSLTNSGTLAWANSGTNPVNFAYHWTNGACPGTTTAAWDGVRTALPAPVAARGSVSGLTVSIVVPPTAGTYCLVYDLVREGVTWFSWQGAATQSATVTVS